MRIGQLVIISFGLVLIMACGSLGKISLGPNGLSADQKYIAEQNAMAYSFDKSTTGTSIKLMVYSDSGNSITALGLAAIGTFGGAATAGAPGAVVGGGGGALLGRYLDSQTTKTDTVGSALKLIPALPVQ